MKIKELLIVLCLAVSLRVANGAELEEAFVNPPDSARPGVYWYFMDGNLNREEMVKDLESMKEVGLGNLVFLEVNVGVPRGPEKFMSDRWQDLFANAVRHAERQIGEVVAPLPRTEDNVARSMLNKCRQGE